MRLLVRLRNRFGHNAGAICQGLKVLGVHCIQSCPSYSSHDSSALTRAIRQRREFCGVDCLLAWLQRRVYELSPVFHRCIHYAWVLNALHSLVTWKDAEGN